MQSPHHTAKKCFLSVSNKQAMALTKGDLTSKAVVLNLSLRSKHKPCYSSSVQWLITENMGAGVRVICREIPAIMWFYFCVPYLQYMLPINYGISQMSLFELAVQLKI